MKTCAIIYNPICGKKTFHHTLPNVESRLETLGYTCNIYKTEYANHATALVKKALDESKPELLIVAGGDGTFNEVLNGLMACESKPTVGYIPTGTSCDLGSSLGIKKDIDQAMEIIEEHTVVRMDVGLSTFGYFSYVCASGSYIDISYETPTIFKKLFGYLAYVFSGIKRFFKLKKYYMVVKSEHGEQKGLYTLAMVLNSKRVASMNVVNRPVLDDGKLDVALFKYTPFLNNMLFFISFILHPYKVPRVKRFKTAIIEFEVSDQAIWNQDGEKKGKGSIKIEVVKQALPIIINKNQLKYFQNQK